MIRLIDVKLTTTLYKRILGEKALLEDLKDIDPVHHKSLLWMLKNDITDVIFETFAVEHEAFGSKVSSELMPGGGEIDVTEENKEDYVNAYLDFRFHKSCGQQIQALRKGFFEVVPEKEIAVFRPDELELMLNGRPTIALKEWQKGVVYKGGFDTESETIRLFWK